MKNKPARFTRYQKLVIAIVALMQFSVVLDFLIMAPLGTSIIKELNLSTAQFGFAVSVYAFSAGASGILVAGFADKYPRKSLLLFAYAGFTIGTLLCSVAGSYLMLVLARMVAGTFGGIVYAMVSAIIADVFSFELRGRVMSFVQFAFSACQIAGLPAGIYLSSKGGWHLPFIMITLLCVLIAALIWKGLRPVVRVQQSNLHPLRHLYRTARRKAYLLPYFTTLFISLPAYMFFPFTAQYLLGNAGITQTSLSTVYLTSGLTSTLVLPFIGKYSDRLGKGPVFVAGSALTACTMAVYVHLEICPLWLICLVTALLYVGLLARSVSATALMTAVPTATDRGAFMSINSAMQQIGGGLSSVAAGYILTRRGEELLHFDIIGYICIAAMAACCFAVFFIFKTVTKREALKERNQPVTEPVLLDEMESLVV